MLLVNDDADNEEDNDDDGDETEDLVEEVLNGKLHFFAVNDELDWMTN